MMLKPSIDELLKKVDSKYTLVVLEGKRAHELAAMSKEKRDQMGFESVKPTQQALEEIVAGKVVIHPDAEAKLTTIKERDELLRFYELDKERRIKDMIDREQKEEEEKQKKSKKSEKTKEAEEAVEDSEELDDAADLSEVEELDEVLDGIAEAEEAE